MAQHLGRAWLRSRGVRSRRVPNRVAELHVYEAAGAGDLPPFVVVHGLGSSATPFGRLVVALRERSRRVLAPDLPGHGFSASPDAPITPVRMLEALDDLLAREAGSPPVLFGCSLGGGIVLRYALERPERVAAVALASPAGARLGEAELAELLSVFRVGNRQQATALLRRLYNRPPWYLPALAGGMQALMARPSVRQLISGIAPDDQFAPAELGALRVPALLLWGKGERLLPPACLEWLRQELPPHAVVEEPEEFGHCPHLEHPQRLAGRLLDFASQLPVGLPLSGAARATAPQGSSSSATIGVHAGGGSASPLIVPPEKLT